MADHPSSHPTRASRSRAGSRRASQAEPGWVEYPDLVVELDEAGSVLRVGGPWNNRPRLVGTALLGHLPVEQRAPLRAAIERAAQSGEASSIELHDPADDVWWWYRVLPRTGADPEDAARVAVIRSDVSESRQQHASMQRRLALLETLLANARDGMALASPDGKLVLVNRALCDMIGFAREELLDRSIYDLIHPDEMSDTAAQFRRLLTGKVGRIEAVKRCLHRDGHTVRCRHTATIVRSADQRPEGLVFQVASVERERGGTTARDRYRTRHLEAERFAAVQRLAREVTDTLQGGGNERWDDLVNKLTILAGTGGSTSQIDLNQLLESQAVEFRRALGPGRSLRLALKAAPSEVRADQEMLRAILLQLLANAREATVNGGEVILETRLIDLDRGYCLDNPGARQGPHIQLSVSDTGCGMDRETRLHASEPFFSTKDRVSHRGMGLSLARSVVKRAGGHLCLYSEVGRGTSVKLLFPVTGSGAPPRHAAPAISARDKTVLVVEEDPARPGSAASMLTELGFRTVTAEDGKEALGKLTGGSHRIDLVLLDVGLSGPGGPETYDRIRALDRRLPVCLLTGYSAEMALETLTHADARMLTKPFGLDDLAAAMDEALAEAGSERIE